MTKRPSDLPSSALRADKGGAVTNESETLKNMINTIVANQFVPSADRWQRRLLERQKQLAFSSDALIGDDTTTGLPGHYPLFVARDGTLLHDVTKEPIPEGLVPQEVRQESLFCGDTALWCPQLSSVTLQAKDWQGMEASVAGFSSYKPELQYIAAFLAEALAQPSGLPSVSFLLSSKAKWDRLLKVSIGDETANIADDTGTNNTDLVGITQSIDQYIEAFAMSLNELFNAGLANANMNASVLKLAFELAASPFFVTTICGRGALRPSTLAAASSFIKTILTIVQGGSPNGYGKVYTSPLELVEFGLNLRFREALDGISAAFIKLQDIEQLLPFLEQFALFSSAALSQLEEAPVHKAQSVFPFSLPNEDEMKSESTAFNAAEVGRLKACLATPPSSLMATKKRQLDALYNLQRISAFSLLTEKLSALKSTGSLHGLEASSVASDISTNPRVAYVPNILDCRVASCLGATLADENNYVTPKAISQLGVCQFAQCDINKTRAQHTGGATGKSVMDAALEVTPHQPHLGVIGVTIGDQFIHFWTLVHSVFQNGDIDGFVVHVLENSDTVGAVFQASAASNPDESGLPRAFMLLASNSCNKEIAAASRAASLRRQADWEEQLDALFSDPSSRKALLYHQLLPNESLTLKGQPNTNYNYVAEPWLDSQAGTTKPGSPAVSVASAAASNSERGSYKRSTENVDRIMCLDPYQLEAMNAVTPGAGLRIVEGVVGSGKTYTAASMAAAQADFRKAVSKEEVAVALRNVVGARKDVQTASSAVKTASSDAELCSSLMHLAKESNKVAEEVCRYQSLCNKYGPSIFVGKSKEALRSVSDTHLNSLSSSFGFAMQTASSVVEQSNTRSYRAPITQTLDSVRSASFQLLHRIASMWASGGITLTAARTLCGPKLRRFFHKLRSSELHRILSHALPGSISDVSDGLVESSLSNAMAEPFPMPPPQQGTIDVSANSASYKELLRLDSDMFGGLDDDTIEVFATSLITEQESFLHELTTSTLDDMKVVCAILDDVRKSVALSAIQKTQLLTCSEEECIDSAAALFHSVKGYKPTSVIVDGFDRLSSAHLFSLPSPAESTSYSYVLFARRESFLSVSQKQSVEQLADTMALPTWGQYFLDAVDRVQSLNGSRNRLAAGKRFFNKEIADICSSLFATTISEDAPLITAGVAEDGVKQDDIPGLPNNVMVWGHPAVESRQLVDVAHVEATMALWLAKVALFVNSGNNENAMKIGWIAPECAVAPLQAAYTALLSRETVAADEEGDDHAKKPNNALQSITFATVDDAHDGSFDLVVVSTCANSSDSPWLRTPEWLWQSMGRATKGCIVIGSLDVFTSNGVLQQLRDKVFEMEISSNPPMWVPRKTSTTVTPTFCVLPLNCPNHKKKRSILLFDNANPTVVNHVGSEPCKLPCLQKFAVCSAPELHSCLELCHTTDPNSPAALHERCPFPCPKKFPCGHPCMKTCGKHCGDCQMETIARRECGQPVVVGYVGDQPQYRIMSHFVKKRCGDELEPCMEPVERTCPQCGFTGTLPCSAPVPTQCNNCLRIKQATLKTLPPGGDKDLAVAKALQVANTKAQLRIKMIALKCQSEGPEKNPQFVKELEREEKAVAEQESLEKSIMDTWAANQKKWIDKYRSVLVEQEKLNQDLEMRLKKMISVAVASIDAHGATSSS